MQSANERQMNLGLLIMRVGAALSQLVYALPRLIDGRGAPVGLRPAAPHRWEGGVDFGGP